MRAIETDHNQTTVERLEQRWKPRDYYSSKYYVILRVA